MTEQAEKFKTELRLPPELADRMKALAAKNLRSFNSEVVVALREYVKREETKR